MSRLVLPGISRRAVAVAALAVALAALGRPVDLQAMIDAAPDGGRVVIPHGQHVLDQGLRVAGRHGLVVTARFGTCIFVSDVNQAVLSVENCSGVKVESLHLRHLKPLKTYDCHGPVVDVAGSDSVEISNCELDGCGAIGVHASSANGLVVRDCWVHRNTFNAFYLNDCHDVLFCGNVVEDNAGFIQAYGVDGLEMYNNLDRRNGGYWAPADPKPGPKRGRR